MTYSHTENSEAAMSNDDSVDAAAIDNENPENTSGGEAPVEAPVNAAPPKKQRDGNYELLRIIAMMMIICMHLAGYGEVLLSTSGYNHVIISVFDTVAHIAVDIFVMISAWYLIDKKIKWQKFLQLELQIFFYSAVFYIGFIAFNAVDFTWESLLYLLPTITGKYWFASSYFIFYAAIPLLNAMLANITKRQHLIACIVLYVLILFEYIPNVQTLGFSLGTSAIWFMTIFIIMYYIKKHGMAALELPWWVYAAVFVGFVVITYFYKDGVANSSPFIFIESLCVFALFGKIKIQNSRAVGIITVISSTTFGVYLIHENPFIRDVLYFDILHVNTFYQSPLLALIFIGYILAIFIACGGIEYVRQLLFSAVEKLIWRIKSTRKKKVEQNNE